jgi:hypothetical protein
MWGEIRVLDQVGKRTNMIEEERHLKVEVGHGRTALAKVGRGLDDPIPMP